MSSPLEQSSAGPTPPSEPSASGLAELVSTSLIASALTGFVIGVIDGLWSFRALHQYLPTPGGKLRVAFHLGCSYAVSCAVVGAALAGLFLLLARHSRLSTLSSFLEAKEPHPKNQPGSTNLVAASFVLAGVPVLGILSALAYSSAYQQLAFRKHQGLIVAASIGIALATLIVSSIATFLAAAATELALRNIPAGTLIAKRLRTRLAPLAIGISILAIAAIATREFWWPARALAQELWMVPTAFAMCLAAPMLSYSLLHRIHHSVSCPLKPSALYSVLAVTGTPIFGLALGAAYWLASKKLGSPSHILIASAVGFAGIVLVLAGITAMCVASLLACPTETLMNRLGLRSRASQQLVTLATIGALLTLGGIVLDHFSHKTLRLLPLRPLWVILGVCALAIPMHALSRGVLSRYEFGTKCSHHLGAALLVVCLFIAVVATGAEPAVRKSQARHSGLGEPLAAVYRVFGDWDRDGYSRWLGGGDCDDSNPKVNPSRDEIPLDGIDNNCVGGDATDVGTHDTRYAAIPTSVPADFNVLLITIDTIRADHLGVYGYKRNTSPNIDALAASGTQFVNGWAHAPSTRYSIPAILTGRHPLKVRYFSLNGQWPGISEENLTIAEVLQSRGLTTGAILNYWYFDPRRKMNQGFDHYDNQNQRLHKSVSGNGPAKTSGSSSKEQTDSAIAYITQRSQERFFLWVHYYDPHYDYEKHPGIKSFGDQKIDAYDHEIAYTDHHVGRLLKHLKTQKLDKNTVVVLTGDHGEGFGEHGIDLHGYHLYAAQTAVPLIVHIPGVKANTVTMPAAHADILPTLANLAGFPSDPQMLGRSLLGVMTGAEDPHQNRYVYQQLSYENNNEYRAAASAKCHVLYNISPNLSWELYRIDQDPLESRDIISSPGECADAQDILSAWYERSEIPEGAADALLPTLPVLDSPIQIQFGEAVELLEIKLPSRVRRSQAFDMRLTWRANETLAPGWKVFAHFESTNGGRFTSDHTPVRPFAWWTDNQIIRYRHHVTTKQNLPPGIYHLWFGIYRKSDRLLPIAPTMTIADRRVKLATIEILP